MTDMTGEDLNREAARIHMLNERWWRSPQTGQPINRNMGEMIMLQISELAEAMEGHRKSLPDDKLPHRAMFEVEIADAMIRALDVAGGTGVVFGPGWRAQRGEVPGNVGEGLLHISACMVAVYDSFMVWDTTGRPSAQDRYISRTWRAVSALMDFAFFHRLDLWGAVEEKLAFNAVREDHTDAHRLGAHGKKY